MDTSQASRRLNELLDSTFASVKPALKWRDGDTEVLQVNDSVSNQPNGKATVSKTRYLRTKVSKKRLGGLMGVIERHWKASGYKITNINPKVPSFVGLTSDGFSIRFSVGRPGNVYFDAASPSVEDPGFSGTLKEGDKFPPDSDGDPNIMPDVHDPFWSH
ncbi:hypothetical protein [Streptomyces sp. NPDC048516]|uniref:hypothetical protein n=1 Tax=Streptomyces sp. NPDC048516 TaxID=3365565 RepID=UPI00371897F8